VLEAFHWATDILRSPQERKIANEIIEGAGDYLSFWYLTPLITAEMSDHEALRMIESRRALIERARYLVPSLLSLFGVNDDSALRSALVRIDECCDDFPLIKRSTHEKKLRREAVNGLRKLKDQIASINNVLDAFGRHVDSDFDDHMEAVSEVRKELGRPTLGYYEAFREQLHCLSLTADIMLSKESQGVRGISVGDNKAKTHIVEYVYSISIRLDRPPFVTTPASDFSAACGLLYELVSGESDVSLAGAINKFARSDLRKRLDEDEKESRWEDSDDWVLAREADNFSSTKEDLARLGEERRFWEAMIASKDWRDFDKTQIAMRLLHIDDQIESASHRHGPLLVWASQISEHDQAESWRQTQQREAQRLKYEVELGRRRRKRR